ncbi:alpha/beta fold hydrolase [Pseudonocardia sp. HH130630-07]|uniref:alpha/beta fold hydrolase n=1 Tax=Pseudonocardia sp. HH130630-07 TaxID=1690815 RepID=UPI00081527FF|nr:alpha/beta hydrolase [Pseudonocardia sp. HH130630-07]ANY06282.1 hydrolase [Pseudonocardia sp. HH130630-07]
MPPTPLLGAVLAAAAVLPVTAAPAPVAPAPASAIAWAPCRDTVADWDPADARSECGTVTVPVDHDAPGGRTLDLRISRIPAASPAQRRGVIVTNPGGPGNPGLSMPADLSTSAVGGLATDHDIIGFDPRGVGQSAGIACAVDAGPDPGAATDPEQRFHDAHARTAAENTTCAQDDPELVGSLSTNTVADDVDAIRRALGEERIGFYGVSWGTALGAVYRSRHDAHVDRMLLDSVMPPDFSVREMNDGPVRAAAANLDRFARWAADGGAGGLGATPDEVAATVHMLARRLDAAPVTVTTADGERVEVGGANLRMLLDHGQRLWPQIAESVRALRDGGTPPLVGTAHDLANLGLHPSTSGGIFMQTAVMCNDQGADPDAATLWREQEQRRAAYPLTAWKAGYQSWCAGWPLPARPWHPPAPGDSALQLVGHRYETTTPYEWAEDMQRRVGGALLTVEDDVHGSLSRTGCGDRAVAFFRHGRTDDGACSG